jgi:hypothetical protein
MIKVLLWIWQFPQNIVGLVAIWILRAEKISKWPGAYLIRNSDISVCYGEIILMNNTLSERVYKHETGHRIQSRRLGIFYLLIIGVPSLVHLLWYKKHTNKDYFSFWIEAWADKLAGIKR